MTAEITSGQLIGRLASRWWLWFAILAPAAASAVAGAAIRYRSASEWVDQTLPEIASTPYPVYVIGVRDYLPLGATMAALTVLCTAVGAQLLARVPWRSAAALGCITAALVLGDSWLLLDGVWLVLASIWTGTVLLWTARTWTAAWGQGGSESARRPDSPDVRSDRDHLVQSTHRVVAASTVCVLMIILGLIVFIALGGLQLYFFEDPPRWGDLAYCIPAQLAVLALWAGWLSGRHPARPHATVWQMMVYVGVALGAVEDIVGAAAGTWSITLLAAAGVAVAAHRQRLASRAGRLLSS